MEDIYNAKEMKMECEITHQGSFCHLQWDYHRTLTNAD